MDSDSSTERVRVVFVHGSLGTGGAEVLRLSVLGELVKRDEIDVRVCVLRDAGELAEQCESIGVEVDVLGNRGGLLDLGGIWRLSKYLRQRRPSIVQSSQFLTNLQTMVAARLSRVPVRIIEEHGIYQWKRWYHRILDRWVNGRAEGVVACSHAVGASAACQLGRSVESICVVHNCASASHFDVHDEAASATFRDEWAGGSSFVACVIGTLRWEKGHKYLLDAWKSLIDSERIPSDSRLWIVGKGPLESGLNGLAEGIGGVQFLGLQEDVKTVLGAVDLFVLPSVNEGFGIAIVEAMCAGLPVVATTSGGIPEVIEPGKTGVLVPPGDSGSLADAIARLSNDSLLRKSLGTAARVDAGERFTPSRYVDKLMHLYSSLGAR